MGLCCVVIGGMVSEGSTLGRAQDYGGKNWGRDLRMGAQMGGRG